MAAWGAYHGKASFEAFTHRKGVLKKGLWPDIPLRYPPYTEKKLGLIRREMCIRDSFFPALPQDLHGELLPGQQALAHGPSQFVDVEHPHALYPRHFI